MKPELNGEQRSVALDPSRKMCNLQTGCDEWIRLQTMLLVYLLVVLAVSCGNSLHSANSAPLSSQWQEFQGTWTATGSRNSVRLANNRTATVSTLNGSLVLAGPSQPGRGFRSEAIVFNDTETGLVGRAVWTDERGDCAYSELQGEGTSASNKIRGTFVGGTGRYSGATGTYEFSWRFLLENEDGNVQGQSVGLTGKVRVDTDRDRSKGESHS
jgi:hypothetical protein